jgi:hypothetical protein
LAESFQHMMAMGSNGEQHDHMMDPRQQTSAMGQGQQAMGRGQQAMNTNSNTREQAGLMGSVRPASMMGRGRGQ